MKQLPANNTLSQKFSELKLEINRVYNEPCLETMKRMPNDLVDLVITSPPYNMNLRIRNGKYCSRQVVKEFSTKYANFSDNLPIDEFYELHSTVLRELLRVSKIVFYNIQIVTGSKRAFFKIIGEFSDSVDPNFENLLYFRAFRKSYFLLKSFVIALKSSNLTNKVIRI